MRSKTELSLSVRAQSFAGKLYALLKSAARIVLPESAYKRASLVMYASRRLPGQCVLEARIRIKWCSDKQHLPLMRDHYELYAICHRLFWNELHDFPDLVNPRDFNDRIQWLKLFDQTDEHLRCSDKIRVRDYVRERVGDEHLTQIYQVAGNFEALDFDALPRGFVIKANNDSGTVIIVRDKSKLDKNAANRRIQAALTSVYGWENGEWAYAFIRPKVFVEELLNAAAGKPPADFRFHCLTLGGLKPSPLGESFSVLGSDGRRCG